MDAIDSAELVSHLKAQLDSGRGKSGESKKAKKAKKTKNEAKRTAQSRTLQSPQPTSQATISNADNAEKASQSDDVPQPKRSKAKKKAKAKAAKDANSSTSASPKPQKKKKEVPVISFTDAHTPTARRRPTRDSEDEQTLRQQLKDLDPELRKRIEELLAGGINARELMNKAHHQIVKLAMEHAQGKEKRAMQRTQLASLGARDPKLKKIPLPVLQGLRSADAKRKAKHKDKFQTMTSVARPRLEAARPAKAKPGVLSHKGWKDRSSIDDPRMRGNVLHVGRR